MISQKNISQKNIKNTKKNEKILKNPKKNVQKATFISVNIRGLSPGLRRDKMIFLNDLANEMNSDFIFITETHLKLIQDEAESNIPGWNETRCDRLIRSHGGVIIYTRDYIPVSEQYTFSNGHVEIACNLLSNEETALVCIYRPPDCPAKSFVEALDNISDWIGKIEEKLEKAPTIIISGDLNFPTMKTWNDEDISKITANYNAREANNTDAGSEREQISKLLDLIREKALSQEVDTPTRGTNTLDLIFSNNNEYIDFIEIIENVDMSDHNFLVAHINKEAEVLNEVSRTNFCSTSIPEFNLQKATTEEWRKARETFSNKAELIDTEASSNDIIEEVIKALELTVVESFIKNTAPDRSNFNSRSLIPRAARTLMKQKVNISRSIQKSEDPVKIKKLKDKISKIEDDLRKLSHKRRSNEEKKARENLKTDPSSMFNLVKKRSKKTNKIGPLKRNKENESWSEAEILNKQYESVFTSPDPSNFFKDAKEFFKKDVEVESEPKLNSFEVNQTLVLEAIDQLSPNAAPGPDGIPSSILKQLKFEVTPVLTIAFEKSLSEGKIPKAFSKAFIKPIKKPKKPRCDPAAYRPVSLTSNLAKILEHLVKKQLQKHLEEENHLNSAQHGFRPNRSCVTQLLDHYDKILKHLEDGKIYDVVYLDFAKAFDTVDRFVLSKEMLKIGIQNEAATWLFEFLQNRTQQVLAENQLSLPTKVISGVPQGTVLGPQLFLILINSLTEEDLAAKLTMFADDTRVGHEIMTEDDIRSLQRDLDNIFTWQKRNNMSFNEDKFELVRHGDSFRTTTNIPRGVYTTEDGTEIKCKNSVRDLGIQISAESDFREQINKVCKDARNKAHWIFRTFYARDVSFLSFMWRIYIQPILDYGVQLWAPSKQAEIKLLEDVFRNYSSRAQNDNHEPFDFWDRIRRYGIRSQQRRAERFRIICVWKVLENISPNCNISWETTEAAGRICNIARSPNHASRKVKSLRDSSFQAKGPELFNTMPFELRAMSKCSLNTFKNALDKFLDWVPDTPLSQKYHPSPMDMFTSKPSNSLVDWIRFLGVSTRHPLPLKNIVLKIKTSPNYIDFNNSRLSSDSRLFENFPNRHPSRDQENMEHAGMNMNIEEKL